MRTGVSSRNSALQSVGDAFNNGFVRFYSGSVPLDPDTALTTQVLIVECALSSPAMLSPSSGQRVFNTIADSVVAASGTPTFARFFSSDGVTAKVDMDVPDEIVLSKASWTAGEPFPGPSVVWTMPAEC